MLSGTSYAYASINGTIKVFAIIGGIAAHQSGSFFLMAYVPSAPSRVAMLPKIMSHMMQSHRILLKIQPIKRPGTAALVKNGSMVSASDILTWMVPLESPTKLAIRVNTTYSAAIMPACVIYFTLLFFILNTFHKKWLYDIPIEP